MLAITLALLWQKFNGMAFAYHSEIHLTWKFTIVLSQKTGVFSHRLKGVRRQEFPVIIIRARFVRLYKAISS